MNSDELAAALLDSSPDGLVLVDEAGRIEMANRSAGDLFGYPEGELIGRSVEELVPDEVRPHHVEHRAAYRSDPAVRPMGTGLSLSGRRRDGSLFPVEISISPVTFDDRLHTIATVRDVSERVRTDERLALMRDRERIARDLHDVVIQRLFAAGMSLQAVEGDTARPIVGERIRETVDELDAAIRDLRAAIFRLGGEEQERTVSAQLAELVLERERALGFVPSFEVVGDVDSLADFVVEQLVATVNEGLSNVARHAGATSATVRIEAGSDALTLRITDDGVGMGAQPKRRGGLSNMMWRAAELGGECTVSPAEPNGLTLFWTVPV